MIKVSKESINLREKLNELKQDTGLKGQELMRADTVAEARTAIGAGRKNLIINGGFDVWQRGTSFSTNWTYNADRWKANHSGATATTTRQTFTLGQTDVPNNPKYYQRFDITTANNNSSMMQLIEDVRILSGQTLTLSFWAKGTNPPAGTFVTMSRQSFGSGGSSSADTTIAAGRTLTSSWQKFTSTFTLGSVAGKTIGANDYTWFELVKQTGGDTGTAAWQVDIAQVQLELGSVATDFEHRSYGEELALCQRFYEKSADLAGTVASNFSNGTAWRFRQEFKVQKRTTPTVSLTYAGNVHFRNGSTTALSSASVDNKTVYGFRCNFVASNSTYDAGYINNIQYTADAEL